MSTVYVNPTNGVGELKKIFSDGPYRSAADDFKI